MSVVIEEAESGFTISVSGRLLFIRHWGVQSCSLGRKFAQQYSAFVKPLLNTTWAEVIDLMDVRAVEQGHKEQIATLYLFENLQNNVATAYIISDHTPAELLLNLQQLMATQTASFADEFFRSPIEALNWVNQRLAMAN